MSGQDLKEPLIDKQAKDVQFTVQAADLAALFNLAHQGSGESLNVLKSKYHGSHGLLSSLNSSQDKGISSTTIASRQNTFGDKCCSFCCKKSCDSDWAKFRCLSFAIFTVAAFVSLIIELCYNIDDSWVQDLSLLIALFILGTFCSTNRCILGGKTRQFLDHANDYEVKVVRDGSEKHIPSLELVVGDIIKLESGNNIPADCLIVHSVGLAVDESAVNGKKDHVHKDLDDKPFLLSGSQVVDGHGTAVVVVVGNKTVVNNISVPVAEGKFEELSHLKQRLFKVSGYTCNVAYALALVVFIAFVVYDIKEIVDDGLKVSSFKALLQSFIVMMTLVIVFLPDGLNLMFKLTVTVAAHEVKAQNNLIRKLETLENVGHATCICVENDGILSSNCMSAVAMCIGKSDTFEHTKRTEITDEVAEYLGFHWCHSTTGTFEVVNGKEIIKGPSTDSAMLRIANEWGFHYEKLRSNDKVKLRVPFNSSDKIDFTVVEEGGKLYVFAKGDANSIADMCYKHISKGGHTHEFDGDEKNNLKSNIIAGYASRACRPVGFAYKIIKKGNHSRFTNEDGSPNINELKKKMIFIAVLAVKTPPATGISETVKKLQDSGITVRLSTGGPVQTAIEAAKSSGMLPHDYQHSETDHLVITGEQFRRKVGDSVVKSHENSNIMTVQHFEEFKIIVSSLKVLARATPMDKTILVTGLRQMGEVVVQIGAGTADAPAMVAANASFTMNSSTDTPKQVAGGIVTDDKFPSIFSSVLWGRNIFDVIGKYLSFHLVAGIIVLVSILAGSIANDESPIAPIQLIWIGVIINSLVPMVAGCEIPLGSLLSRKPWKTGTTLLTCVSSVVLQAVYQLAWLFFILFCLADIEEGYFHDLYNFNDNEAPDYEYTIFFMTFFWMTIFNALSSFKLNSTEVNIFNGVCKNLPFYGVIILIVIVQIVLVEFGESFFYLSPLGCPQHMFCLAVGVGAFILGALCKIAGALWCPGSKN